MRNALAYLKMRRSLLIAFVLLITHAALLPGVVRADITHGLIGWWKFDEGTSTTAHDSSGQGSNGTLTGTPSQQWVNGKFGYGLLFHGSDQVNVGASSLYNFTSSDFTVSFWEKSTGLGNNSQFFSRTNQSNAGWQIDTHNDIIEYCYYNSGNSACQFGTKPLDDNRWHLVTLTRSGTTLSFYFDGSFDTNIAVQDPGSISTNFILAAALSAAMDDVRIYNRALSAADVAQLYASGEAIIRKPLNNLGLVAYWNFNEGTSTIAHDFSGHGFNGTLTTTASTLPQWVSGKYSNALQFDGLTNYLVATQDSRFKLRGQAFTISAWLADTHSATEISNYYDRVVSWYDGSKSIQLGVGCNGTCAANRVAFIQNDSGNTLPKQVSTTFLDYAFHHIVATFDGASTYHIYVDGVNTDGGSTAGNAGPYTGDSTYLYIGQRGGSYGFAKGIIDDVRIYNRALSASEVANLYQSGGAVKAQTSGADLHNGSSLQQGLIGYWTFDGKDTPWSSATAGTAIDRSGNGNNGTLTNMTRAGSTAIGKLGQALRFDGASACVDTSSATSSIETGSVTISEWFKPAVTISTASPGPVQTLFSLQDVSSSNDIVLFFNNRGPIGCTDGYLCGSELDNTYAWQQSASSQTTWLANTWYHAVYTFSTTGGGNLYVNGVLQGSNPVNTRGGTYSNYSAIGATHHPCDLFFNGIIDDVRVYNRTLSATEVKQLYKLGQSTVRP